MENKMVELTEYELKLLRIACDHASNYYEERYNMTKSEEYEVLRRKFQLNNR